MKSEAICFDLRHSSLAISHSPKRFAADSKQKKNRRLRAYSFFGDEEGGFVALVDLVVRVA